MSDECPYTITRAGGAGALLLLVPHATAAPVASIQSQSAVSRGFVCAAAVPMQLLGMLRYTAGQLDPCSISWHRCLLASAAIGCLERCLHLVPAAAGYGYSSSP